MKTAKFDRRKVDVLAMSKRTGLAPEEIRYTLDIRLVPVDAQTVAEALESFQASRKDDERLAALERGVSLCKDRHDLKSLLERIPASASALRKRARAKYNAEVRQCIPRMGSLYDLAEFSNDHDLRPTVQRLARRRHQWLIRQKVRGAKSVYSVNDIYSSVDCKLPESLVLEKKLRRLLAAVFRQSQTTDEVLRNWRDFSTDCRRCGTDGILAAVAMKRLRLLYRRRISELSSLRELREVWEELGRHCSYQKGTSTLTFPDLVEMVAFRFRRLVEKRLRTTEDVCGLTELYKVVPTKDPLRAQVLAKLATHFPKPAKK